MKSSRKHDGDNAYLHINYEESSSTATNCIRFIECLPVPSGALAGQGKLIKLMPWQRELIRGIYPDNKKPRNEVLLSIARRNGKSVTLAGIMCFLMFNKHKKSKAVPGSLMVSSACNRDQASIIFDILALWCATVIELNEASDVNHYHRIIELGHGSKYKAISASARAALGGQYSVVICDEVGYWRDNKLQLALRSGMASTPPDKRLFLQASTVPDSPTHFFFEELQYFAEQRSSPTHYALVKMTNPKIDPPNAEKTWKKSNPSYGVLVNKESFIDEYISAKNFPQRMQGFVAYRCNAPIAPLVDDSARFISPDLWESCKRKESKLYAGEKIVVAWDAASTRDLTAVVAMSVEAPHRTECLAIVPKLAVTENKHIPYRVWAEKGYCQLATTDYVSKQNIIDHYLYLQNNYDVVASQSDLFGYPEIVQLATQQGVSLEVHTARHTRQQDYNDGLEKLAELIRGQQLIHDGNPVVTYCVNNMRIKRSRTGATVVDRELSTKRGNKIDLAISLMLCSLLIASNTAFVGPINLEGLILK